MLKNEKNAQRIIMKHTGSSNIALRDSNIFNTSSTYLKIFVNTIDELCMLPHILCANAS